MKPTPPENIDPVTPMIADEHNTTPVVDVSTKQSQLDLGTLDIANGDYPSTIATPSGPLATPLEESTDPLPGKRGRKGYSQADLDAMPEAKRRKIERDRIRNSSRDATDARAAADGARRPSSVPTAPGNAAPVNPDALAGAALIVQSLDFMRAAISDGECPADSTMRAAVQESWTSYLTERDAKLPPWALVVLTSGMYLAPALHTPKGADKIKYLWLRAKDWWAKRRLKNAA